MIVHDEGENDAGSTPCKDSTLIVRQVLAGKKQKPDETIIHQIPFIVPLWVFFIYTACFSILCLRCDHVFVFLLAMESS